MRYVAFDVDKCVGCQICQLVCSGVWEKVFNPFKAKLRIEQTEWYGEFKAHICRHEDDPECVKVCPTGALYLDEKVQIVRLDREKCDGCGECIEACPYDAIFVHPDSEHVYKCDLCGGGKIQQCVEACPKDALHVEEVAS